MYGESVFTTMRIINGALKDWNLHFDRMKKGIEFVYGRFTDGEDWPLILKNKLENKFQDLVGDKVLRLTVYREQARGILKGGPISINDLSINLSFSPLDPNRYIEKRIKLRTCPVTERPNWWPSYLKAGNYLDTILKQKIYLRPEDDDVLFLSNRDTILESSVANIFVVRHDKLYTPPLGPNVLEGVMRKKIINVALDYFTDCTETETTIEQLFKADAIFGSNSIRGLFLIDRIDDHEILFSEKFIDKFNSLKNRVFE